MKKSVTLYVPWFYSTDYFLETCPRIFDILAEFIEITGDDNAVKIEVWNGKSESLLKKEPGLIMFFGEPEVPNSTKGSAKFFKRSLTTVYRATEAHHFLFWYNRQLVYPYDRKEVLENKPQFLKPPKDQLVIKVDEDGDRFWSKTWALELEGNDMETNLYEFLGFGENLKIADEKHRN
ncbi:MAG: hypothetical protein L3J07_01940 [Candidatus Magasanikbacteria bacterium]|nr:hypothetical protein [Candidatus Magasanikbacteria bacterium]